MRRSLALVLAAIALAGCGGGKSDEEQVRDTVRQFFTALQKRDAKKFCDEFLTEEFIRQSTGATGDRAHEECRRQFRTLQASNVELARIHRVRIKGGEATVRATVRTQGGTRPQVFRLKKEDGDWRLEGGGTQ